MQSGMGRGNGRYGIKKFPLESAGIQLPASFIESDFL